MTTRDLHKLVSFLEDGNHMFRVHVNMSRDRDVIQLRIIKQHPAGGVGHYWMLELPLTEDRK